MFVISLGGVVGRRLAARARAFTGMVVVGAALWVCSLVAAAPALGADQVYWINYGAPTISSVISFANLDGTGGGGQLNTTGATVPSAPLGVAIDAAANKIYWANPANNTISFANLDNTGGGGQLNTTGATVSLPRGVAIDPSANKIYWVNPGDDTISFANLDNTGGGGQLNTTGATVNSPYGVAIDAAANKIYWTGYNTISFANLDNTGGGGQLNTSGANQEPAPAGVAIDPSANKIYWANPGAIQTISFANLDGTGGGGDLNTTGAIVGGPVFLALLKVPSGGGAPTVSGGSRTGSTLSCSQGVWAADVLGGFLSWAPQSYRYSWTRNGATILGASSNMLVASSPGTYACQVTAQNPAGAATQNSAAHAVSNRPLELSVSPRRTQTGRRTCFALKTTSSGHVVAGVTVRFARHTARTSHDGTLTICLTLHHRTYHPRATKTGYTPARATITATAAPTPRFTG